MDDLLKRWCFYASLILFAILAFRVIAIDPAVKKLRIGNTVISTKELDEMDRDAELEYKSSHRH